MVAIDAWRLLNILHLSPAISTLVVIFVHFVAKKLYRNIFTVL
jgi:hypothetical protein